MRGLSARGLLYFGSDTKVHDSGARQEWQVTSHHLLRPWAGKGRPRASCPLSGALGSDAESRLLAQPAVAPTAPPAGHPTFPFQSGAMSLVDQSGGEGRSHIWRAQVAWSPNWTDRFSDTSKSGQHNGQMLLHWLPWQSGGAAICRGSMCWMITPYVPEVSIGTPNLLQRMA